MLMNKRLQRVLALLCCFGLLLIGVPMADSFAAPAYADAADDLKDLNSQIDELEKQQKALQADIDNAKSEKSKQEAIKKKTAQEITILKEQIAVLVKKIALQEEEIARKEVEIENLNGDIEENYQLFKDRMRAIYMSDTSTTIGLVLGADSYGDYLARSETVKRVAEHDRELIAELNDDLANLEQKKADLDAEKQDLDAAKISVEAKNRELDSRLATTVATIQNLDDMEKQFLADKAELQKQMKEMQAEVDRIYAELRALEEDYIGGEFIRPVPGYTKISSYYGWRFGGSDYHTGIDFPAPNGTTVVASNGGEVTYTNESYVQGRGYGRYMIVDHGGGYTTLYAHLSAITVPEGYRVRKGEQIARVGNTGWSTGPHLHFEIRLNKVHQNPLNFL